jgi:hypothetical protein
VTRRGRAAAAAGALLLASPFSVASATAAPACAAIGFGTGHTVFCAYVDSAGRTVVRRSDDGGRQWGAAHPVAADTATEVTGIVVSPRYASDHILFVGSTAGLFWSNDAGVTFATAIHGPGVNLHYVTPYVDTAPADILPRAALAFARPATVGAEVFDTVTGYRNVPGAPMQNDGFFVPPDFGTTRRAVVLADDVGVIAEGNTVRQSGLFAYSCVEMTCTSHVTYFGDGLTNNFGTLPGSGRAYVIVEYFDATSAAFASDDGGLTWHPWASVTGLLRPWRNNLSLLTITASADAPRRMYLYVAAGRWGVKDLHIPANQLYRSDDAGVTWHLVGSSWRPEQHATSPSTLPWRDQGPSIAGYSSFAAARPGGLLYVVAAGGMHCSRDLGRTWRAYC